MEQQAIDLAIEYHQPKFKIDDAKNILKKMLADQPTWNVNEK